MPAFPFPPPCCRICERDLPDEAAPVAYGDCPVCGKFVCEACDGGYDHATGQSVCPDHADDPRAAHITEGR